MAIKKDVEEIPATIRPIVIYFLPVIWEASRGKRNWNKLRGIIAKNKRN